MHYFKRNIGDYHKKAGRLNMLEHGAYTLLMDAYYDREHPPTKDDAIEWCWARTDEEIAAVSFVLSKFFTLDGETYRNKRIDEELDNYKQIAKKNKEIAQERERKKKEAVARSVNGASPQKHESPPNHKPLTINQEPYKQHGDSLNANAWLEYLQYRRQSKLKKLTESGEHKKIKWLIEQGGHDTQQEVIDQTISNGWTGLFELKRGNNNAGNQQTNTTGRKLSVAERATEARKQWERDNPNG